FTEGYTYDLVALGGGAIDGRGVAEQLTEEHLLGAMAPSETYTVPQIGRVAPLYPWAKGLIDLSAAAILIVFLSPLMALVALAIRFDSPGPALFRQQRIGLRGR